MPPRVILVPLVVLTLAACSKPDTKPSAASASASASPWDPPKGSAVAPAPASGSAIPAVAMDGWAFNGFFPKAGADDTTDTVSPQPKRGRAEVTYRKGKDDYVTLSISDTNTAPAVRDDYKASTEKLNEWPLKTSGTSKSAILVANRFEVTASSPRLTPEQRKAWLARVDLASLAKLAK